MTLLLKNIEKTKRGALFLNDIEKLKFCIEKMELQSGNLVYCQYFEPKRMSIYKWPSIPVSEIPKLGCSELPHVQDCFREEIYITPKDVLMLIEIFPMNYVFSREEDLIGDGRHDKYSIGLVAFFAYKNSVYFRCANTAWFFDAFKKITQELLVKHQ